MIYYVVTQNGRFGMEGYLHERGSALRDRIRIVPYGELLASHDLPPGTYIFAALDQLSADAVSLAARVWKRLSKRDGVRLLNHPTQALRRYDLLRTLAASGRSPYTAYRVADLERVRRFPVFIRGSDEHTGSLTDLLHSNYDLKRGLIDTILRGHDPGSLLIVEFCDTSEGTGLYRKYAAMVVAGKILPRCLEISPHWVVKYDVSIVSEEAATEELIFVQQNPHVEWLREICGLAQIDFGRIDYGVLRGEPVLWEINTNPTIGPVPGEKPRPDRELRRELVAEARSLFHPSYQEALKAIDVEAVQDRPIPIDLPERAVVHLNIETRCRWPFDAYQQAVERLPNHALLRGVRAGVAAAVLWASPVLAPLVARATARRLAKPTRPP